MPTTTSGTRAVPYSLGADLNNTVDDTMKALAEFIRDDIQVGVASARPAFGATGRRYYATDTGDVSLDTGTSWVHLQSTATAELAASGSAAYVKLGTTLTNTNGPGLFSVAATLTSGGGAAPAGALTVSQAGLYRYEGVAQTSVSSANVAAFGTAAGALTSIIGNAPTVPGNLAVWDMTVRLAASEGVYIEPASGTVTLVRARIERVGP